MAELPKVGKPKIIVFASIVTKEQKAYIRELQAASLTVEIRDPAHIRDEHQAEPADGIHRFDESIAIPKQYADYPDAESVIEKRKAQLAARRGNDAPPVKANATTGTDSKPAAPPKPAQAWGKGK